MIMKKENTASIMIFHLHGKAIDNNGGKKEAEVHLCVCGIPAMMVMMMMNTLMMLLWLLIDMMMMNEYYDVNDDAMLIYSLVHWPPLWAPAQDWDCYSSQPFLLSNSVSPSEKDKLHWIIFSIVKLLFEKSHRRSAGGKTTRTLVEESGKILQINLEKTWKNTPEKFSQ